MAVSQDETIFALSSGGVPSGVAIIRISGPRSQTALKLLAGDAPVARQMRYGPIKAEDGEVIDRGLAVFFPAPHSFTGEDCVELHIHGSRATVARLLQELASIPGLRAAEAGEFTLRAFRNARIDLTEAEALSDLIAAETERQRQLALANASGLTSVLYSNWRSRIVEALAFVEAVLDFADEEDAPEKVEEAIWTGLESVRREIESHVKRFRSGQIIRDGYRVAIIGPPNAGKSSLLNVLAGRDVAIVTSEPGTTRDVIEVDLDLGGLLVKVADTAGVRETEAEAERLGVERSLKLAELSDMILLLQDMTRPESVEIPATNARLVRIGNKADLAGVDSDTDSYELLISTKTGERIDALLRLMENSARQQIGQSEAIPFRERHVALLRECIDALSLASQNGDLELRAEDLRHAANSIGRITGKVDVEDLLDVIFSRFCIGK